MSDDRFREDIITEFFLRTCQLRRRVSEHDVYAWRRCAAVAMKRVFRDMKGDFVPLTTGSVAEFHIEPMLSSFGDMDVMYHRSLELALPEGYPPPAQLPAEFDSRVAVHEMKNSEFPGYVYLERSYLLTECVDDDKYNAVQCERFLKVHYHVGDSTHGPAFVSEWPVLSIALAPTHAGVRRNKSPCSLDTVGCVRCLIWPSQAADWPTRRRNYGWPDSATVDRVVSNGCDVVGVAHHLCRLDEWKSKRQWRLSFSRAEITLLNSWMQVQQIAYHMLRVFVKSELPTDTCSDNNSGGSTLSNYNIKTMMLWACELKSRSWWTDDLNLVRICVKLLRTMAVWLTDARCKHYFIDNCNLFDRFEKSRYSQTANGLMSTTKARFCEWCINSYILKCAQLCPVDILRMLRVALSSSQDALNYEVRLQTAVSKVVKRLLHTSLAQNTANLALAQWHIGTFVSHASLTLRSYLCWMSELANTDYSVRVYFTAFVFLHVAYKTMEGSLTDELLDVLATACLQLNDTRRCLNARHSSVLSLCRATILMKVVANNNSRSTVQQIKIELSKAYLHRALRCKDSDSDSIYCLANVYLAVLYYTTGQYHTALDHCALVTRLQDQSQYSSRVVQGELLPRIDDQVESTLGLTVFYQHIRDVALNKEQERQNVSVLTSKLLAHYLRIKLLSVTKCHWLMQIADEIQQYRYYLCNLPVIFVTDVIVFRFANGTKYPCSDREMMVDRGETKSLIRHQLDTSKLVELLQRSAVEHLTACRELEACTLKSMVVGLTLPSEKWNHFFEGRVTCTTDFKVLYAYKCGHYEYCLQLSVHNAGELIRLKKDNQGLYLYPELFPLLDDDIVSLIGLALLVNPSQNSQEFCMMTQLSLSLYLMTQCLIRLHQSVTWLATTLDCVRFARCHFRRTSKVVGQIDDFIDDSRPGNGQDNIFVVDHLVLKFVEQKILRLLHRPIDKPLTKTLKMQP